MYFARIHTHSHDFTVILEQHAMATKPKDKPRRQPVYVPIQWYEILRDRAASDKRTIQATVNMVLEAGMRQKRLLPAEEVPA